MPTYTPYPIREHFPTPFAYERRYNPDGSSYYIALDNSYHPSGIAPLDAFMQYLIDGSRNIKNIAKLMDVIHRDLVGCIRLTTGFTPDGLLIAYQTHQANQLLRYTALSCTDVAKQLGLNSSTFAQFMMRHTQHTPVEQRYLLRQKGDSGRYTLALPQGAKLRME